jgi:hypothetical protein
MDYFGMVFVLPVFYKKFLKKFLSGREFFRKIFLSGPSIMSLWRNPGSALQLPWQYLTSEKIPFRGVKAGKRSEIVNRAPFAKRGHYRAISKRPEIPVYPKSGEFRENGTIRFFPGP